MELRDLLDDASEITLKDYDDNDYLIALNDLIDAFYKVQDDMFTLEYKMDELKEEVEYHRDATNELLRIKGFL